MEAVVERKEGYLQITNTKDRHELGEVVEGINKIRDAALAHDLRYVLADHRRVHYHLPLNDAFNLVKVFEYNLPDLKEVTMAVVTNEANLEIARFWESICKRRGYRMRIFLLVEEARDWLQKEMKRARVKNS